ncbi:cytochrome c family protein [Cereibacter sp. SYSU M97828]|nr:cytochrome c family protein [Cereibacter flavus]
MRSRTLAIILTCLPALAAAQEGDAEAGQKVFRKCMACHAVDADAPSRAGPNLHGIVGRTTGTLEGFSYSDAMKKAGEEGHVWTPEEILKFVENPKGVIPGTKMTFAGLKQEQERVNLLAYLETQSQ